MQKVGLVLGTVKSDLLLKGGARKRISYREDLPLQVTVISDVQTDPCTQSTAVYSGRDWKV